MSLGTAKDGAYGSISHIQLALGSGNTYIAGTALLLQLLRLHQGTAVREHALLHTSHKHHRELQAFGRVKRHESNPLLLQIRIINIRQQSHFAKEVLQIWFFLLFLLKILGYSYKLLQVFNSGFIFQLFLRLVIFQGFKIAGSIHNLLNQIRNSQLVHALHKRKQKLRKFLQRIFAPGG